MLKILISLLFSLLGNLLSAQQDFSFVFVTDIHLQHNLAVQQNFSRVAGLINAMQPDFVISGGDMIYTAKDGDEKRAADLFNLADSALSHLKMPIYYAIGNHELVGVLPHSGIEPSNPMWGKEMYQKRYAKAYYSFTFSNWKFIVLDAFKVLALERRYVNSIDSVQMNWLKNELLLTSPSTPIAVIVHAPLLNPKAMFISGEQALTKNSESVLKLFDGHNLRVVLQGHNHIYMNLFINGRHFISGGTPTSSDNQDPADIGFVYISVKSGKEKIRFINTSEKYTR